MTRGDLAFSIHIGLLGFFLLGGTEATISSFADHTKLRGMAAKPCCQTMLVMLPSKGTLTGWGNGLTETS